MSYRVRDLDETSGAELDTVTRWCMRTVLETIPEFEGSEAKARETLSNFSYDQMRSMIRADFARPTHRFLVAVDSADQLVGHSMISRKVDPQGRQFGNHFSRFVLPEHRRQGLGRRLLIESLAWFDQEPWDYLVAHTHATNVPLRCLFESRGFRVVERKETPWPVLTLRLEPGFE